MKVIQLLSIVAGSVLATQVKTMAEAKLQPAAERLLPPAPGEKERGGADPTGHPDKMPPTVLADRVEQQVGEDTVPDGVQQQAPQVLHWVTGIGLGTGYGLLAHRWPVLRTGHGALFGATAFAATHATSLPALGLQARPAELPKAWWGWELGSHLVYGVTVDTVQRLGNVLSRAGRG